MTPELRQDLPPSLTGRPIGGILLNYQKRVVRAFSSEVATGSREENATKQGSRAFLRFNETQKCSSAISAAALTVVEKSRRIGVTWAIAAAAVLTSAVMAAAGGMDTYYVGYEKEMTREFVDTCAMWAKAYQKLAGTCSDVEEFLFLDEKQGEDTKSIQAFRIRFASGFDIVALCSRPRSLRGRQGFLIADEAAFHDELEELIKAALAFCVWGGRVLVISTHDGADNPFNELVEDVRAGRQPGAVLRITFDDAIADGLYERVRLTGKHGGKEKAEWIAMIRGIYRANAAEELDVIPKATGGAYLSTALILARMRKDIPVIRYHAPAGMVDWTDAQFRAEVQAFCGEQLAPVLARLDPALKSCFGQDFGRSGDLSVIHPLQIRSNLECATPFMVELRDVPFAAQSLILCYLVDRLPRFLHGALDAGGNGASHAEAARRRYGLARISEVKFSAEWYRVNMPPFRAAFEDGAIDLPMDDDILSDYRANGGLKQGTSRITDGTTESV